MGRRSRDFTLENEGDSPSSGVNPAFDDGRGMCPETRTRLIGDLCALVRHAQVPAEMKDAGLTLIGFLARRMPGEPAHALGVREARRARRR